MVRLIRRNLITNSAYCSKNWRKLKHIAHSQDYLLENRPKRCLIMIKFQCRKARKGTIVGVLETTNLTIMTEKEEERILPKIMTVHNYYCPRTRTHQNWSQSMKICFLNRMAMTGNRGPPCSNIGEITSVCN